MWEVLDKGPTMKDPKDILFVDLDQQSKWAIRIRQELEQYLRRVEKTKNRETKRLSARAGALIDMHSK